MSISVDLIVQHPLVSGGAQWVTSVPERGRLCQIHFCAMAFLKLAGLWGPDYSLTVSPPD